MSAAVVAHFSGATSRRSHPRNENAGTFASSEFREVEADGVQAWKCARLGSLGTQITQMTADTAIRDSVS
jgi:hypothetical protein